jgi:hypothetical protein
MDPGKLEQSRRKLRRRAGAMLAPLIRTQAEAPHLRPLSGDPLHVAQAERRRRALGTAPWDRHARTALTVDPKHVSPRAMVTHEVKLDRRIRTLRRSSFNGWIGSIGHRCRCRLNGIGKREDALHHDRISDGDSIAAMSNTAADD